jgi:hypothetical protein
MSLEMPGLSSARKWEQLWIWLAEAEEYAQTCSLGLGLYWLCLLGLAVLDRAIKALLEVTDKDLKVARAEEKIRRRDVMVHIYICARISSVSVLSGVCCLYRNSRVL